MAADLDSGSASDAVLSLASKMQYSKAGQDLAAKDSTKQLGVAHLPLVSVTNPPMPSAHSQPMSVAASTFVHVKVNSSATHVKVQSVTSGKAINHAPDEGKGILALAPNGPSVGSYVCHDAVIPGPEPVGAEGLELGCQQIDMKAADLRSTSAMVAVNQQAQGHDRETGYPPVREMESGEGPPYAPPGWRWRVGRRQANGTWTDRYFYPPGGKREFASKKQVEHYLKYTQPGIDLDAFWETYRWRIPAVDGSGEKRRPDTSSDAAGRPVTSDTAKRAKSSRESSPAERRAYSVSPGRNESRSCPKRSATCGLNTGKSLLLNASKVAPCDVCCAEEGFCRTCSCVFCNGDVRADGSSTSNVTGIWCSRSGGNGLCGHAAHLRCALLNKAAVSNRKERTINYLCRRCEETNILSLDDGRPVSAGDSAHGQQSQSTSLASGTSKLDASVNGLRHGPGALEALLSAGAKGELERMADTVNHAGRNGFNSGGERMQEGNGLVKEEDGEKEGVQPRMPSEHFDGEHRRGQSSSARLDSARAEHADGDTAHVASSTLEALNSFTGRSDGDAAEPLGGPSHHNQTRPDTVKGKPEPASEDPSEEELARALLHLPDGLAASEGAPPLLNAQPGSKADHLRRSKELLIAVTDGLRERGESGGSDSGDEPQASTPGRLEGFAGQTLAGRRILAEEKGVYGLRKSSSQQSFDSGYSTPPEETIDGISRPRRARGRARTPRTGTKPSPWARQTSDGAAPLDEREDEQLAAEAGFEGAEKQWNIPPKKRGGPGRPKRKLEVASREPSVGLPEDASDDENSRNPPKSRFVTDGFHRTAAKVKKEGYIEVAPKRGVEDEDLRPIPLGSKVPRASRSARHPRAHISASFFLSAGEQDSPAQSDSQPQDSGHEAPGSSGVGPTTSSLKRKLEAGANGQAPKRKGRPPGSKKDAGSGRGLVVDFESDLDGAMNGGFGAAKAWLHQQAGLTPLETRQLTLQEERVHGACRTLKQQIDSFSPSGRTLFSRLDDLIDTLKVAKDKARYEIGEYHKIVVRLLDNRGVHVQMY